LTSTAITSARDRSNIMKLVPATNSERPCLDVRCGIAVYVNCVAEPLGVPAMNVSTKALSGSSPRPTPCSRDRIGTTPSLRSIHV
jgi:hypothetical protein